jgi:hypothetical protein
VAAERAGGAVCTNHMRIARVIVPLAAVAAAGLLWAGPLTAEPGTDACHAEVDRGALPEWARAGFSDPGAGMPHVVGRAGDIAAILFGDPLLSPPSTERANKILWASRPAQKPLSDLRIEAQRMDGRRAVGRPVSRTVTGGPGPSTVDLPAAGCWRLTLRWSGRSDELDLQYVTR